MRTIIFSQLKTKLSMTLDSEHICRLLQAIAAYGRDYCSAAIAVQQPIQSMLKTMEYH